MDTLPSTERTTSLNPKINPRKYEHPHQVEDLNLSLSSLTQGIQSAKLCSVCASGRLMSPC